MVCCLLSRHRVNTRVQPKLAICFKPKSQKLVPPLNNHTFSSFPHLLYSLLLHFLVYPKQFSQFFSSFSFWRPFLRTDVERHALLILITGHTKCSSSVTWFASLITTLLLSRLSGSSAFRHLQHRAPTVHKTAHSSSQNATIQLSMMISTGNSYFPARTHAVQSIVVHKHDPLHQRLDEGTRGTLLTNNLSTSPISPSTVGMQVSQAFLKNTR